MIKFNTEKELIEGIKNGYLYRDYIEDRITNFLGCSGSDIVKGENEEPSKAFEIEIEERIYEIGVTSIEIEEDTYKSFFWLK